jgi:hypothetical protein
MVSAEEPAGLRTAKFRRYTLSFDNVLYFALLLACRSHRMRAGKPALAASERDTAGPAGPWQD